MQKKKSRFLGLALDLRSDSWECFHILSNGKFQSPVFKQHALTESSQISTLSFLFLLLNGISFTFHFPSPLLRQTLRNRIKHQLMCPPHCPHTPYIAPSALTWGRLRKFRKNESAWSTALQNGRGAVCRHEVSDIGMRQYPWSWMRTVNWAWVQAGSRVVWLLTDEACLSQCGHFLFLCFFPVDTLRLPELLELLPSLGAWKTERLGRSVWPSQAQFADSKWDLGEVTR